MIDIRKELRMKDYEALSQKHFDGQAAEYDRRNTYYYSQNGKISCRDIAGQIKDLPYESLLDVGCGTGFLMELLTKQRPARYCGADLSGEMIRVAKEKRIDNHIIFRLMKSGDCHTTNRKGIEKLMEAAGFIVTDSRQVKGMIYTVTGKRV